MVKDWCLDLCLLEKGLIDSIVVRNERGDVSLMVRRDSRISAAAVGRVSWHGQSAALALSGEQLETWLHFYLTYYRDGIGEVDHLDVEVDGENGSPGLDLVLTVPNATPPQPGAELRTRLGLD
jgi:hypothetical protein